MKANNRTRILAAPLCAAIVMAASPVSAQDGELRGMRIALRKRIGTLLACLCVTVPAAAAPVRAGDSLPVPQPHVVAPDPDEPLAEGPSLPEDNGESDNARVGHAAYETVYWVGFVLGSILLLTAVNKK